MMLSHRLVLLSSALVASDAWACNDVSDGYGNGGHGDEDYCYGVGYGDEGYCPSGSEVAVSAASGALNNNSGSAVAWAPRAPKTSNMQRVLATLNPVGTAYAATWSCSAASLLPAFDGALGNPYAFTPPSCRVAWLNGRPEKSSWSGPFILSYGSSCDAIHSSLEKQAAGCELTRTSNSTGDTRTIAGPAGNTYAINHDTNGAGTGWDSSVSPAPTSAGVRVTCGANGCVDGGAIVISGSHLTGTVTFDGANNKIWDHTVSTGASGLMLSGAPGHRVLSGSVTVQHNLHHYTSTTTFASVVYGDSGCCFPTTGSVSTAFTEGPNVGKTEKLLFSSACGETTLTFTDGTTAALTLIECL